MSVGENKGMVVYMKLKLAPKLFLLVALVLVIQFLLIFAFGSVFIEKMYISDKEKELRDSFKQVKKNFDITSDVSEQKEFLEWATELAQNRNTRVTVFAGDTGRVAYTNARIFMSGPVVISEFGVSGPQPGVSGVKTDEMKSTLRGREYVYLSSLDIDTGHGVVIHGNPSQLYLLGASSDYGSYYILETSLESIKSSAGLAVRFSLWGGGVALFAGLITAAIVAYLMARPIKQMKRVAGKLTQLDFSERASTRSRDEIGELGVSINQMSDSMLRYTSELRAANDRLLLDIQERLKAEAAQKQLVSNISHELKTPLSLISGYAEGLQNGMADTAETRAEYCDVILDESRRMTRLIHQLLGLARLQSGIGAFEPERVELSGLCEDMTAGFMLPASGRGVELERNIEPDIAVFAEAAACEQVLSNYLSNALRHVPDGGTVRVSLNLAENGRARLCIYNSGSEISNEDRLWDSFYRADQGRNREDGAVGLGLSIVKAHMLRHNMPCGAGNTEGGAEFWAEFSVFSE